jgi:hypothetical protein
MPREQALATLHLPFGTAVRNPFKLWAGNEELLASCGTSEPEECSSIIFEHLGRSLRDDANPELVRRLDCQSKLAERIEINYKGFDKMTVGQMLDSIQRQIDQQMALISKSEGPICQSSLRLETKGDRDLKCFVRAEFAKRESSPIHLDVLWGWVGWRNGFQMLHDPPTIRLAFNRKCAWPGQPRF